MRNLVSSLASTVCIFSLSAIAAVDSPIQDAYKALRLLAATTESGVSYQNFRAEWAKTNGVVTIALEDSKPGPATTQLQVTKDAYNDLSVLWQCSIEVNFIALALQHCIDQGFKDRNPDVIEFFQQNAAKDPLSDSTLSAAVPVLMNQAHAQVKALGEILKGRSKGTTRKAPVTGQPSSKGSQIQPSHSQAGAASAPRLNAPDRAVAESVGASPEDHVGFLCHQTAIAILAHYSDGKTMDTVLSQYGSALVDHARAGGIQLDAKTISDMSAFLELNILAIDPSLVTFIKSSIHNQLRAREFIDAYVVTCRRNSEAPGPSASQGQ